MTETIDAELKELSEHDLDATTVDGVVLVDWSVDDPEVR